MIMFQQERQKQILDYINTHKKVRTKDLSRIFKASVVTIRADINELDRQGEIVKVHGGALAIADRFNLEIPSQSKVRQNQNAKKIIGKLAAELVDENDIIIIDAGSTTLEVAKAIKRKSVTVITNDLKIGMTLVPDTKNDMTLMLTGGTVEPYVYTLCGMETQEFLKRVKVNKLFLGCDAVDVDDGITNRTAQEVSVKRAMMAASVQVIAVTDSSKLNKSVFMHVCDIQDIDILVTDKISKKDRQAFEDAGVQVLTPHGATDEDENQDA